MHCMKTTTLTGLAVVVALLCGFLVISLAMQLNNESELVSDEVTAVSHETVVNPPPGTTTGSSAVDTSVTISADNVATSVTVK